MGTFRNCADVQINSVVGSCPPGALALPRRVVYQADNTPLVVTARVCLARESHSAVPGMDEWCHRSCLRFPPNCPTDKCKCYPTSVDGTNNHVTDSRPSRKPFWFLQQPQQQSQFYSLVPGPVLVNPGWRQFR